MNPARRILAFALVPLSATPFVAIAPHAVPLVQHRVQQLSIRVAGGPPAAPAAATPVVRLRRLDPPWPKERRR